jgi:RNA polymerase sigma-70 factor (ECF subfamily)
MERETFADLLQRHKDAVYGYALHLAGSAEDAEDIVQHVFLTLWRRGDDVRDEALQGWLLRVCRNACFDLHRRRKVRRDWSRTAREGMDGSVVQRVQVGAEEGDRVVDLGDSGAGADAIEQRVDAGWLVRSMQQLPEQQRAVLVLREIRDMTYEDIATTLGISLGAVKVTLHRARRRLRELVEAREGEGALA